MSTKRLLETKNESNKCAKLNYTEKTFDDIPYEVLYYIISFLNIEELINNWEKLCLVNKKFNAILKCEICNDLSKNILKIENYSASDVLYYKEICFIIYFIKRNPIYVKTNDKEIHNSNSILRCNFKDDKCFYNYHRFLLTANKFKILLELSRIYIYRIRDLSLLYRNMDKSDKEVLKVKYLSSHARIGIKSDYDEIILHKIKDMINKKEYKFLCGFLTYTKVVSDEYRLYNILHHLFNYLFNSCDDYDVIKKVINYFDKYHIFIYKLLFIIKEINYTGKCTILDEILYIEDDIIVGTSSYYRNSKLYNILRFIPDGLYNTKDYSYFCSFYRKGEFVFIDSINNEAEKEKIEYTIKFKIKYFENLSSHEGNIIIHKIPIFASYFDYVNDLCLKFCNPINNSIDKLIGFYCKFRATKFLKYLQKKKTTKFDCNKNSKLFVHLLKYNYIETLDEKRNLFKYWLAYHRTSYMEEHRMLNNQVTAIHNIYDDFYGLSDSKGKKKLDSYFIKILQYLINNHIYLFEQSNALHNMIEHNYIDSIKFLINHNKKLNSSPPSEGSQNSIDLIRHIDEKENNVFHILLHKCINVELFNEICKYLSKDEIKNMLNTKNDCKHIPTFYLIRHTTKTTKLTKLNKQAIAIQQIIRKNYE
jgi:hypothetical protein